MSAVGTRSRGRLPGRGGRGRGRGGVRHGGSGKEERRHSRDGQEQEQPEKAAAGAVAAASDLSVESVQTRTLKSQFASQLVACRELFPDWTTDDILFALQEANGDLEVTISRISEGHVTQWGEVKRKPAKEKARPRVPEAGSLESGDVRNPKPQDGQHGSSDRGRGRGDGRGRGRGARAGSTARGRDRVDAAGSHGSTHQHAVDPATAAKPLWEETQTGWDVALANKQNGKPTHDARESSKWGETDNCKINGANGLLPKTPASGKPIQPSTNAVSTTAVVQSSVIPAASKFSWASIVKPAAPDPPTPKDIESEKIHHPSSGIQSASQVYQTALPTSPLAAVVRTDTHVKPNVRLPQRMPNGSIPTSLAGQHPSSAESKTETLDSLYSAREIPNDSTATTISSLNERSQTSDSAHLPPGLSKIQSQPVVTASPVVMPNSSLPSHHAITRTSLQFGSLHLNDAPPQDATQGHSAGITGAGQSYMPSTQSSHYSSLPSRTNIPSSGQNRPLQPGSQGYTTQYESHGHPLPQSVGDGMPADYGNYYNTADNQRNHMDYYDMNYAVNPNLRSSSSNLVTTDSHGSRYDGQAALQNESAQAGAVLGGMVHSGIPLAQNSVQGATEQAPQPTPPGYPMHPYYQNPYAYYQNLYGNYNYGQQYGKPNMYNPQNYNGYEALPSAAYGSRTEYSRQHGPASGSAPYAQYNDYLNFRGSPPVVEQHMNVNAQDEMNASHESPYMTNPRSGAQHNLQPHMQQPFQQPLPSTQQQQQQPQSHPQQQQQQQPPSQQQQQQPIYSNYNAANYAYAGQQEGSNIPYEAVYGTVSNPSTGPVAPVPYGQAPHGARTQGRKSFDRH